MVSGLFPFAMLPAAKLLVKHLTIAVLWLLRDFSADEYAIN